MTQAEAGPLTGLRVIEIGQFVAAPFCTRLLTDLGADVVKIEPPGGDPVRKWGGQVNGNSVWFSQHSRNKKSITLNLKHQVARDIGLRWPGPKVGQHTGEVLRDWLGMTGADIDGLRREGVL